ncbi:MAG: stage II sporulation protein P, partial [Clostridiales bacterium]|nr:stage II sporulation protein P [Clostridiales bacterium]
EDLQDADELLSIDLSIEQEPEVPQILIYHTHSQEAFSDSEEGEVSDTVVGMGEILSDELRRYGYNVIHDTGMYDLVDGVLDRSAAYDYARASIEEILEENPTIEVIIDLHRDGVNGTEEDFVTEVDGKAVSRIMFFNGLSRDAAGEALSWLPNSYVKENLAFSLQLQVLANAEYSGFTRKIYLQAERYNLHLRARSLLIEAGTQMNTVAEEQNAMALIANLLQQLLNQ